MAIIENKYLLDANIKKILKDKLPKEKISQFYTKVQLCKEIRFRKIDDKYYKTIRTGSDIRKNTINKKISKKSYQKAKDKKIGHTLKKSRYTLNLEGKKFAVDIYKGKLKNLYILEKSFKSLQKSEKFELPKALNEYIVEDVSHNNRYRNKNLALLGNPKKSDYEIYKIFKDIEKNPNINLCKYLFDEMEVSDAARVTLYKNLFKIYSFKDKTIDKKSILYLQKLQMQIKITKILLKEFRFIFDPNSYKSVYSNLCSINKSITIYEEFNILKNSMPMLESSLSESAIFTFLNQLDEKIEYKKNRAIKYLQSREFNIILNQFKLLLKESNNINKDFYSDTNLLIESRKIVKRRFKKFKYLAKKYDKCYDLDSYKKIESSLIKLEVALSFYPCKIKSKDEKKLQKAIEKTHNHLYSFIVLNQDYSHLKEYISNSSKTIQKQNKILQSLKKYRKDKEKNYNTQIENSIKYLKQLKRVFNS
ncbi:MAG: hypothetical protein DSZ06_01320 [Sulfurospirillum sp.]|nr:MAG: hypothetical protein DSZ06_01320 [Sulfurospirillum sp.]